MQDTLEQIYRRHRRELYAVAVSVTRHTELAEDAVHEAFARLCRRAPKPEGDPVAYTFAAVRNAAIDLLRSGSQPAALEAPIYADAPDPVADAVEAEQQQGLRDAVAQLPAERQQVIVLKLYGDLTFQQIAEVLGEPLGTVTSRYWRTLRQLRTRVESRKLASHG